MDRPKRGTVDGMSSRWVVRIIGIAMLIGLLLLLASLQKRLVEIERTRGPAATTTTTGTR